MKGKTQKGITLIALIITVVVLLILAATAISSIQNDGIISHANNAAEKYNEKQGKEDIILQSYLELLKGHDIKEISTEEWEYEISENYVILRKYKGKNQEVNVPRYYKVNGKNYEVQVGKYSNSTIVGPFNNNTNITKVTFETGVVIEDDNAGRMFEGCKNLISVNKWPGTIYNMASTFYNCTSLIEAPKMPSTATDISYIFYGCSSLKTFPELPYTVTKMRRCFLWL